MMIRVRPEDIYTLRNATGRPFTDHMDRLLRSSASVVGITAPSISDNPRTNVADGGVDTEISGRASRPDPWGYFGVPTVWQYKAVEVGSLSNKVVAEEITLPSKQYVRSLLTGGYGYRLCICHDGTAERKAEIKAVLLAEIQRLNMNVPEPLVLFAKDIAEWTNWFPALAAEMLHTELSGFRLFQTWKTNERVRTPIFVSTPQSEAIRESVRQHLDWTQKPVETNLTISGNAGVGKTRTVLEALAENERDATALVFYSDDEERALELAQTLTNSPDLFAVIVADECMEPAAFRIGRALEGFDHRIRLLTINNANEIAGPNEIRLRPLPHKTVEEILNANFPSIDPFRRLKYVELADGFLRFAILLCRHDAEIVEKGFIGEPLRHIHSYLGALFDGRSGLTDADRQVLDLISLVDRCGVAGNLEGELRSLCDLVGMDFNDTRSRLARLQHRTGLLGQAGRYMYVSPTPIAMVCFQSAWDRWVRFDTPSFMSKFPTEMKERFLPRASRSSTEVGKVVSDYFRDWILSKRGDIFSDNADTQQLLLLVRADPDRLLPWLRDLVLGATPEQLAPGYRSGRRSLIADLPEIARYPEWFEFAENMLFHLSLHEAEPDLGNSATKLWTSLYGILSSGVATPFLERLAILQRRTHDPDPVVRRLCALALGEAIEDRSIRTIMTATFGRRVPPDEWRPKTWDEYFDDLKLTLHELHSLCTDVDVSVCKEATKQYIQVIRSAIFRNILGPAKEGAGVVPDAIRPILRAELREILLLNEADLPGVQTPISDERGVFIREWMEELNSKSIRDQLLENVGPSNWSHHFEQSAWEERIRDLAARLLHEDGELTSALPWLNSGEAGSAVDLGVAVGQLDQNASRLEEIATASEISDSPEFLRGYYVGLSLSHTSASNPTEVRERANATLDALWKKNVSLAYRAMVPSGDFLDAFRRTIEAVANDVLGSHCLDSFKAWCGPRHTTPQETKIACETLLRLAKSGNAEAANDGLEFIQFLFMRHEGQERRDVLRAVFGDEMTEVVFGLLEIAPETTERLSYSFGLIFASIMEVDTRRAIRLVMKLLKSRDPQIADVGAGLLPSAAKIDPSYLMEVIGAGMLNPDRSLTFVVRKIPIAILPSEVVIAWLRHHGIEGARVLARHVPPPFLDNGVPKLAPVTEFLMENYGDDDTVSSSFAAGLHSGGVFTGPISEWVMRGVSLAERFVNHPIPSVRRWAVSEVEYGTHQADQFRQREAEDLF